MTMKLNFIFSQERVRRQLSLFGTLEPCPELGSVLQHFSPDGFEHILYRPHCPSQMKPKLTLFTRTHMEGCLLTHQDTATQSLSTHGPCLQTLQNLPKVVFLVHGFDIQNFGRLGVMRMLGTGIDAQVGHLLAAQAVARQHALDSLHHHTFGMRAFEDLLPFLLGRFGAEQEGARALAPQDRAIPLKSQSCQ